MSSTGWICFWNSCQRPMWSRHFSTGCHSKRISSKPSSIAGRLNSRKCSAATSTFPFDAPGPGPPRRLSAGSAPSVPSRGASSLPCSASACAGAPFSFRPSSHCLYSSLGSPSATTATFRKPGPEKCARASFLASAIQLPFASVTTQLRAEFVESTGSSADMPRPSTSERTPVLPVPAAWPPCPWPLFETQSLTMRSLRSACPLFLERKNSGQSAAPSPGSSRGNTTSRCPPTGAAGGAHSQSSAAASCTMRHSNGSLITGWLPKFTRTVMPL
mmetsp:Transcript_48913/g.138216  ORF Transcript_48913/g.138216 Transcript_48913/m.138216 type:complete len:273 (-) Transcript_48913:706-1524(-)